MSARWSLWAMLLVMMFFSLTAANGFAAADAGAGDDDGFEEVEPVVVKPQAQAKSSPSLLGKLHPLMVHLPIGWLLLLLLTELWALRSPRADAVGLPLAVLTLLAFIPAITTGLLRAADSAKVVAEGVLDHRNVMLATSGVVLLAVALRLWRRKTGLSGPWRGVYLLLLLAATVLITIGGHLGGKLVFGESYLPF